MSQLNQQRTKCHKDQKSIQSGTTPDPGYQWESDKNTIHFEFKGVLGSKFQFHSDFKSTFCKQTVQNMIRRPFLRRLIWFWLFINVPQKVLYWLKSQEASAFYLFGRILDLLPFWRMRALEALVLFV